MAIYNLSGNFHPPAVESGKALPASPSSGSGTPSASSEQTSAQVASISATKKLSVVDKSNGEQASQAAVDAVSAGLYPKEARSGEQVNNQIEEFQQFNQSINRSIQFEVDDDLDVTIVRVVDKDTDELIRQFPPEELINLSKRLKDLNEEGSGNSGILLQEKV